MFLFWCCICLGWNTRFNYAWFILINVFGIFFSYKFTFLHHYELTLLESLSYLFSQDTRFLGFVFLFNLICLFNGLYFKYTLIICVNCSLLWEQNSIKILSQCFYWPERFYEGLFFLHPLAVYVCICFFILSTVCYIYSISLYKLNTTVIYEYQVKRYILNSVLYCIIALLLGGWWAYQLSYFRVFWAGVFVENIQLIFFSISCTILYLGTAHSATLKLYFINLIWWFANFLGILKNISVKLPVNINFDIIDICGLAIFIFIVVLTMHVYYTNLLYLKKTKTNYIQFLLKLTHLFLFITYIYAINNADIYVCIIIYYMFYMIFFKLNNKMYTYYIYFFNIYNFQYIIYINNNIYNSASVIIWILLLKLFALNIFVIEPYFIILDNLNNYNINLIFIKTSDYYINYNNIIKVFNLWWNLKSQYSRSHLIWIYDININYIYILVIMYILLKKAH